jgi:hypothetical protein
MQRPSSISSVTPVAMVASLVQRQRKIAGGDELIPFVLEGSRDAGARHQQRLRLRPARRHYASPQALMRDKVTRRWPSASTEILRPDLED